MGLFPTASPLSASGLAEGTGSDVSSSESAAGAAGSPPSSSSATVSSEDGISSVTASGSASSSFPHRRAPQEKSSFSSFASGSGRTSSGADSGPISTLCQSVSSRAEGSSGAAEASSAVSPEVQNSCMISRMEYGRSKFRSSISSGSCSFGSSGTASAMSAKPETRLVSGKLSQTADDSSSAFAETVSPGDGRSAGMFSSVPVRSSSVTISSTSSFSRYSSRMSWMDQDVSSADSTSSSAASSVTLFSFRAGSATAGSTPSASVSESSPSRSKSVSSYSSQNWEMISSTEYSGAAGVCFPEDFFFFFRFIHTPSRRRYGVLMPVYSPKTIICRFGPCSRAGAALRTSQWPRQPKHSGMRSSRASAGKQ